MLKKNKTKKKVNGRFLTMQEEAPSAPAQIMTSEMLLPQCFLQSSLDRRGSATCCSLSGVNRAGERGGDSEKTISSHTRPNTKMLLWLKTLFKATAWPKNLILYNVSCPRFPVGTWVALFTKNRGLMLHYHFPTTV